MTKYCSVVEDNAYKDIFLLSGDNLSELEASYGANLKMDAIALLQRKMRSLAEQATDGSIVYDPDNLQIRVRGLPEEEVLGYAQSLHDAVEFLDVTSHEVVHTLMLVFCN